MSAAAPTINPDKLKKFTEDFELLHGGHDDPGATCESPQACAEEALVWLYDLPWTDMPEKHGLVSPVISEFTRRLNDSLSADLRQQIKPHLLNQVGTHDDGFDEQRGWMLADWATRVALPFWLELADQKDVADELRALPEVTSAKTHPLKRLREIRNAAWDRRAERMERLKEELRPKIEEALKAKGWTATATTAATTAAAATATTAATTAAAAAAAAATATAAATAVRDLKVGSDAYWRFRDVVWNKVYAAVKPKVKAKIDEIYGEEGESILTSALELHDRMCALGKGEEAAAVR